MQEKKQQNVIIFLNRLKSIYNFKHDIELANFLGIKQSTFSAWKSRNTFDLDVILDKCKDIDYNRLFKIQDEIISNNDSISEITNCNDANLKIQLIEKKLEVERLKAEINLLNQLLQSKDEMIVLLN